MRRKQCIFTRTFMKTMYRNMWSFMNEEMLKSMFPKMKVTHKCDINDDRFPAKFAGSICFKGTKEEGHYVYVKKTGRGKYVGKGTYESGLLTRGEDDGVCHGAAIAFYLFDKENRKKFTLIEDPQTDEDRRHNYRVILNVYIHLITSRLWDKALKEHFYNDVVWIKRDSTTQETQKSLETLQEYIERF